MSNLFGDLTLEESIQLLSTNYIGRLGFISAAAPFITPITYFYDAEAHCILSYSSEGHKISALRKSNSVALQVDEIRTIQNWKSVLLHGNFEELQGANAKFNLHRFAQGVQETIAHKEGVGPKFISDFSGRLTKSLPIVFRININEVSGKYRDGK